MPPNFELAECNVISHIPVHVECCAAVRAARVRGGVGDAAAGGSDRLLRVTSESAPHQLGQTQVPPAVGRAGHSRAGPPATCLVYSGLRPDRRFRVLLVSSSPHFYSASLVLFLFRFYFRCRFSDASRFLSSRLGS